MFIAKEKATSDELVATTKLARRKLRVCRSQCYVLYRPLSSCLQWNL